MQQQITKELDSIHKKLVALSGTKKSEVTRRDFPSLLKQTVPIGQGPSVKGFKSADNATRI